MDPVRMFLEMVKLTNPEMYDQIFNLYVEQGLITPTQQEKWDACMKKAKETFEAASEVANG